MTRVTAKTPPPVQSWIPSILRRTKAENVLTTKNSDSASDSESESLIPTSSDPDSSLKRRSSKSKALEKLSLPPASNSSRARLSRPSKASPRKPSTSALKRSSRKPSKKGLSPLPSSSPAGSPVAEEALRLAILESEVLSLRAQLAQKDADHASQLASITAGIQESVAKIFDEKIASQVSQMNALANTVAALELALLQPRPLSCYADITSSASPSLPKRPKPSADVTMTDVPVSPKTRAESILDSIPQSQIEYSTRPAPAPKPGVCIVHIHGFNHGRGTPLNVLGAILEVKYNFPRQNIINVSPVNNVITEMTINSSSLAELQSALDVPNCPFLLSTTLDVRAPLSPSLSAAEASEIFDRRMDRVIHRLKSLKSSRFDYIAAFMLDYKDNGVRYWEPESRPTDIYISHFLKPASSSPQPASVQSPSNASDESTPSSPLADATTSTHSAMEL